ncbi:hypothetical protein [Paenibacillus camelliae]|uniref:hypothetical protein n=1 Tax=Paenibacillus camelliae TaxID=512410 RepID=UPI0020406A2B|nr:hypothetical protein [Paenibacillus camelliae]MCM3635301.1 hypothetical protein [Paenibacillus camelliae]
MSRSSRKVKWKNVSITASNVDDYLNDLYHDTKGQYINQGVSFNKDDPYQMGLLKLALLEPFAFSGLCKQLLANHFASKSQQAVTGFQPQHVELQEIEGFVPKPQTYESQIEHEINEENSATPTTIQQEEKQSSTVHSYKSSSKPVGSKVKKKKKKNKVNESIEELEALLKPNPDANK